MLTLQGYNLVRVLLTPESIVSLNIKSDFSLLVLHPAGSIIVSNLHLIAIQNTNLAGGLQTKLGSRLSSMIVRQVG